MFFFVSGDNYSGGGAAIDMKSGQWFGATVSSAGENGPVVVCLIFKIFIMISHMYLTRIPEVIVDIK